MNQYVRCLAGIVILSANVHCWANSSVDQAMDEVIAVTSPGVYESQTRTSYSGGSLDVRIPRKQLNLVTISPPTFSAGCGGISIYFGGFSFVSAEEIMELLENAAQAAEMYIYELAFRALCGDCMETLKNVIDKINEWSRFATDSCALGKAAVDGLINAASTQQSDLCVDQVSSNPSGEAEDPLDARDNICTSDDAVDNLKDKAAGDPAKAEEFASVVGNSTWEAFKRMGIVDDTSEATLRETVGFGMLLMTITGTTIDGKPVPPSTADAKTLVHILMCGRSWQTYGDDPDHPVFKACDAWLGGNNSSINVLQCGTDDPAVDEPDNFGGGGPTFTEVYTSCPDVVPASITGGGYDPEGQFAVGFFDRTYSLLSDAVDRVAGTSACGSCALTDQQKSLIAIAPFPLYKVINIAAVYPSVAHQLISNYSSTLAVILARAYIDHIRTESTKRAKKASAGDQAGSNLPVEVFARLRELSKTLDVNTAAMTEQLDVDLTRQQAILAQVSNINKLVLDDIFSRNLMGNMAHARDLMGP